VLYDVQDPAPFLTALHAAASRRVVLEVTRRHPWAELAPLYRRHHDLDRPDGPSTEDLVAVIRTVLDLHPTVELWSRPGSVHDSLTAYADQTARMLCLPATAAVLHDLRVHLAADATVLPDGRVRTPQTAQATLWWDVDG
jgi:hypothetical protein